VFLGKFSPLGGLGVCQQGWRHAKIYRHSFLYGNPQRSLAVEARHKDNGAATDEGEIQPYRQAVDVVHRKKTQNHIVSPNASRLTRCQGLVHVGNDVVMREHYPLGQSGRAAGKGKGGQNRARVVPRLWDHRTSSVGIQIAERLGSAAAAVPDRVYLSQIWQSAKINAIQQGAVADEGDCLGSLHLIVHFTLAVRGIHGGWDRTRQGSGVKRDAELPAVRQVDSNHLAGTNARGHQPAGRSLHQVSVFRVRNAPIRRAGGVDHGQLVAVQAAGVENYVMNKLSFGV